MNPLKKSLIQAAIGLSVNLVKLHNTKYTQHATKMMKSQFRIHHIFWSLVINEKQTKNVN